MYDTSMAEGGIVGFAGGGRSYSDDDVARLYSAIEQVESGGRPGLRSSAGALGVSQMLPSTARGVAARLGVPFDEKRLLGKSKEDIEYQRQLGREYARQGLDWGGGDFQKAAHFYHGGPNTKIHGPKTRDYGKKVLSRMEGGTGPHEQSEIAQEPDSTVYGAPLDFEANYETIKKLGSPDRTEQDKYIEETRAQLDPKERKKLKDEAKWNALAQFGFRLAASKNPDFLGGVGEAGAATNPELASSLKELKANERELRKEIMAAEDIKNKDKQAILSGALDFYGSNVKAAESVANRQSQERTAISGQQTQERIATAGNISAEKIAKMGNDARIQAARVAAAAGPQDRDTAASGSIYTTLAQMQQQDPGMIGPFLATMGLPQYAGIDGRNMSPAALQTIANQAWEYQKGMARAAGQQTGIPGLEALQGGGGGAAAPRAGTAPPAGFEMD